MKWDHYKKWISLVSEERKEKIYRLRFDLDRIRSMISELVARKYIAEATGSLFESVEFLKSTYGKPYAELDESISFNWSHSGDWIFFAMDKEPVGVDVEVIRQLNEIALSKSFFDPEEVAQLEAMNAKERTKHFFTLWSLKESYIKWKGTGLSTELDSFRFIYNQEQQLIFSSNHQDSCFFQTIQLDPKHFAAVCTSKENSEKPLVKMMDVDTFLNSIQTELRLNIG